MSRGRGKSIFNKSRTAQSSLPTFARPLPVISLPPVVAANRAKYAADYLKLPAFAATELGFFDAHNEALTEHDPVRRLSKMQEVLGNPSAQFNYSEEMAQQLWFDSVKDRVEVFQTHATASGLSDYAINSAIDDIGDDLTRHVGDVGMEEQFKTAEFSSHMLFQRVGEHMFGLDCAWGQGDTIDTAPKQAMHFAVDQMFYQDNLRTPNLKTEKFNPGWDLYAKHRKFFDTWTKAQYECTQEKLKAAGIEKAIAYRLHDRKNPVLNPLSASSIGYHTVKEMANDWRMGESLDVWTMEVPVERIFSTPQTGFGELYQTEIVVMPGRDFNKAAGAEVKAYTQWIKECDPEA
jgi:hypothetical protein